MASKGITLCNLIRSYNIGLQLYVPSKRHLVLMLFLWASDYSLLYYCSAQLVASYGASMETEEDIKS